MGLNEKQRQLEKRLDAVEDAFENLVKAFNSRGAVIQTALSSYDQHIWILQLVVNDLAKVKVHMWPPHPDVVRECRRVKDLEPQAGKEATDRALEQLLESNMLANPTAMIDLEWYLQRYGHIRDALNFFDYLSDIAKKGA